MTQPIFLGKEIYSQMETTNMCHFRGFLDFLMLVHEHEQHQIFSLIEHSSTSPHLTTATHSETWQQCMNFAGILEKE